MRSHAGLFHILVLAMLCSAAHAERAPKIEADGEGNFLFIPGIGKIPMPPGTRAFGPGNGGMAPRQGLGPRHQGPQGVAPPPKTPEQQQADDLDHLYSRLAAAEDEREARNIEAALLRRWARSGSDTIDLLCQRAAAAELAGATPTARALMDYVTALSPYWAEGFVRRARLRVMQDDSDGALGDLEIAARLEPKRFDAFQALGALAEKAGDRKKALDAWRKSLAISPRQEQLRKEEERLKFEVEGRDI